MSGRAIDTELLARFEEETEDLITFMSLSDFKPEKCDTDKVYGNRWKDPRWRVPMIAFDDVHPFTPAFVEMATRLRPEYGYFRDVKPRDVDGQWDVSMLWKCKGEDAAAGFKYTVVRCKSIPLSVMRGHQILGSSVSRQIFAWISESGNYEGGYADAFLRGSDWVQVSWNTSLLKQDRRADGDGDFALYRKRVTKDDDMASVIATALGVQFNRDYDWRILLRFDNGPSISFVTDPLGTMEIFRLRDIPNGKSRRVALRNWVQAHWRRKRSDDAEASRVVAHLRGAEEFTWNGLSGKIVVAPYDRRRAERIKCEAENARAERRSGRGSNAARIA
jgi:hypothetical protein